MTSIEYLLKINNVTTPSDKADIIERALELAYKAHYSMSNDDVSEATKDKIVTFIIAQAYALNEARM